MRPANCFTRAVCPRRGLSSNQRASRNDQRWRTGSRGTEAESKAEGFIGTGGRREARHSTPFSAPVKPCKRRSTAGPSGRRGQSTKTVDNSVDNLGTRAAIACAPGLEVKLAFFSPAKKVHVFH